MQPGNYSDSSESRSVVSDSLWPHRLYSPWNSPGQNTGVGRLSLLQGIFPTQGSNPGLPHCRRILCWLSHKGSPRILEWVAYPISSRSSQPRNRTEVPALQPDSLPTELSGTPIAQLWAIIVSNIIVWNLQVALITWKEVCDFIWWQMVTRLIVMITLQCVQMLNRYIVHLKPMGCCMSIILQLKKKRACGHEFRISHFGDKEIKTSKFWKFSACFD